MSKIYTGNVFLSTSRKAIEKVFFSKSKIANIKDALLTLTEDELKRTFLVTPFKNTNLIELDYSLGLDVPGKYQLRLKFLETNSLFESFFIGKSVESILLNKLYEALYNKQNPTLNDAKIKKVEETIFNSKSDILLGTIDLYFAFGVGSDTKEWAGPYIGSLNRAILNTNGEGIKEIEMFFTCTSPSLQSNDIELTIKKGLEGAINKYNRLISNKVLIQARASVETSFEEIGKDVHSVITKLLKKYIVQVTQEKNVIVFLPDINPIFANFLTEQKAITSIALPDPNPAFSFVLGEEFDFKTSFTKAARNRDKEAYKRVFNRLNINFEVTVDNETIPLTREEAQERAAHPLNTIVLTLLTDSFDQEGLASVIPDFYYPIKRFIDGIKELYEKSNIDSDIVFLEENDLRILKLWKKYKFIEDENKVCNLLIFKKFKDELFYLSNVRSRGDIIKTLSTAGVALDDIGFGNPSYKLEFYDQFLALPINSSFGENTLIQDELSFDKVSEDQKRLADVSNMPIFRYNLRNSNVLSISVNSNPSYMGAFNFGIRKKIAYPFINTGINQIKEELDKLIPKDLLTLVEKSLSDTDFTNLPILIKEISKLYLQENIIKSPDLLLKLNTNQISETLTKDQLVTFIALLIVLNYTANKPNIILTKENNEAIIQKQILTTLQNLAVSVRIKTLPFFRLSNTRSFSPQCLLLSVQNSIIGQENIKTVSYFTGLYNIVGFRHVISDTEMFSEFTLQRSLADTQTSQVISSDGKQSVKELIQTIKQTLNGTNNPLNEMEKELIRLTVEGVTTRKKQ